MITLSDSRQQPLDRNTRELTGTLDRIIWATPESDVVIAALRCGAVVVGPVDEQSVEHGVTYRFMGKWTDHPKHGPQFAFSTYVPDAPATRPGVVKYLMDEAECIGRARAEQLWDRFGADAVRIAREFPEQIVDAGILAADQAELAAKSLRAAAAMEKTKIDLFGLFLGRGFSGRLVRDVIEKWGARAPEVIRRNPFILLTESMPSCGYRRCDKLYLDLGGKRNSLKRQMLAGWNSLREDSLGHTWYRVAWAADEITKQCGLDTDPYRAIQLGIRGGWLSLYREDEKRKWVAEWEKANAERRLADSIRRLCKRCEPGWPREEFADLTPHQQQLAEAALFRPVGILAGTPGCLAGETIIRINRGGKGFSIPISRLVERLSGNLIIAGRAWDLSMPTMVARAENGFARLCRLKSAWKSGIKETFELRTTSGRTIRATADHPFLTNENTFSRLGDLRAGDLVQVELGHSSNGRKKKLYRDRNTMFHPHQRPVNCGRFRCPEHRLAVEAEMNGLGLEEFLYILRNDPVRSASLQFLEPYTVIHHQDRNHINNDPGNLAVLATQSLHASEHAPETAGNVMSRIGCDRVESIICYGEEMTYDIEVEDDPHCFLANGFAVHNTGKTFTAAAIIKAIVQRHAHGAVAVCAPTGKAAVRITAAMQRYGLTGLDATTIHRLLEIGRNGHDGKGWGFKRNRDNPLEKLFVIVDESSMLDTNLAADLLDAIPDHGHILLIGDPYQLPPVGHGAPLRDMIAAGVPCGELSEIHRNAGQIVRACKAIKDGKKFEATNNHEMIDLAAHPSSNLLVIEAAEADAVDVLRGTLRDLARRHGFDPVWDVQVLVAVNKKSAVSRTVLNDLLQGELNAGGEQIDGNPFRVGDKIICLKNCWVELDAGTGAGGGIAGEVYLANGEVGRVESIEAKLTIATFPLPERRVRIPMSKPRKDEQDAPSGSKGADKEEGRGSSFDIAYAITTHKSQGSEWPCVILMADANAGRVASREFIYTAISRASKLTVIIGRRAVIDKQCRMPSLQHRRTFLRQLLTTTEIKA